MSTWAFKPGQRGFFQILDGTNGCKHLFVVNVQMKPACTHPVGLQVHQAGLGSSKVPILKATKAKKRKREKKDDMDQDVERKPECDVSGLCH